MRSCRYLEMMLEFRQEHRQQYDQMLDHYDLREVEENAPPSEEEESETEDTIEEPEE